MNPSGTLGVRVAFPLHVDASQSPEAVEQEILQKLKSRSADERQARILGAVASVLIRCERLDDALATPRRSPA